MTLTVLAIDDSRTIRDLLKISIEDAGFQFECAEDGVDGCEKFDTLMPDVVITDINMPNMDGFGVIEAIRKSKGNRNVPILVLTTENGEELKQRARAAGATGWIVKPFDDQTLVSVLKRVTGFAA